LAPKEEASIFCLLLLLNTKLLENNHVYQFGRPYLCVGLLIGPFKFGTFCKLFAWCFSLTNAIIVIIFYKGVSKQVGHKKMFDEFI
jgi:hypothetical protein